MKTDFAQQIVSIKERSENHTTMILLSRLMDIEDALKNCKESKSIELFKYIPISLVAIMEAYFRSVVRLFIDYDNNYMDNAIKIPSLKTKKFDFDILKALQGKVISGSELISHLIRINNFDDINSIMSALLDNKFLHELTTFNQSAYRSLSELLKNERDNLIIFRANTDNIIQDVINTFTLRHIFCHEVTKWEYKINPTEIESCFNSVKIFLNVCDEYIANILYPNDPLTQTDMNIDSYNKYKVVENEMNDLIAQIEIIYKGDEEFLVPFRESQVKWLEFVDLFMKSRYPKKEPYYYGSIHPLCISIEMTEITTFRVKQIQKWIDGTIEGDGCVGTYRFKDTK